MSKPRAEPGAGDHPIQLSFDRPLQASTAPFVLAVSRGPFAAEGLSVANNLVQASPEAIARAASGASELALVDINELIRYRDKADAVPVFVLFDQAPYAIVGRRCRRIHGRLSN